MDTFSYSPPMHLTEKWKWLLAVLGFEASNSVFKTTDENKSFSALTPNHWSFKDVEQTINKLIELLFLMS